MFKLALCLFLAVSVSNACQFSAPPGSTVTTKTVTTTTTSVSGGSGVGAADQFLAGDKRALIRSSWEKARKNGNIAPQILFRFLKAHPQYQKKFALFADVPQEDLLKNGNFLAQAFTIMAGVNVVVQSLDVPELLAAEASHLGKTHFVRGVTIPMFEQFGRASIDTLREVGHMSDAELDAWEEGFKALIAGIAKSLKTAEDVPSVLTGLTPHQVGDVQRSWGNVRGDRYAMVSAVFLELFGANPTLQSKFHAFDDVPLSSLSSNAAFNDQVKLVADRLDSIISNLNTPLKLGGELRYMAFSHKPRGVLRQEFHDFAVALSKQLAAKGVAADDLKEWKELTNVLLNKIAKIQGL